MTTATALPTLTYGPESTLDEFRTALVGARRRGPIALGQYGPEVLSYDLVRTVLRDSRFVNPQGSGLVVQGITSGPLWDLVTELLISLEGAEHNRLRRLVARAFTPRAAEQMRDACVEVITELVDRQISAGRCDVVADIATPYPVPIICAMLGAPASDWQLFTGWASDITQIFGLSVREYEASILHAWTELNGYVERLIADRRSALGDDLISELIRSEDDGDRLSHAELANLTALLLIAGTDTTRNQLAAAVQVLAGHPEQWELLAQRPDLAPQAVEELMRHTPIVLGAMRVATVDVELGGMTFPAGSTLIVNSAAANRDPQVFIDPDRLDITRQGAAPMQTFGGGVHYCLGAHLARVEMTEALRVITARLTEVRVAGPVPWKPMTGISGPVALPIEFTARRSANPVFPRGA
ncbi:cytochrome P450 [Mycolicibacterium llatzerense]|uniref:cytochrome P450 n=1 Tax=Mycolicibacterium llatzerense TaxID=280871 RepID=UPI0021B67AE0|nr:cytochrome P450 [Mycolicibacterium llatzerense]MCT7366029.1 cytochrome [Mycolicibacterium llatzerense]MCT7368665.1 cytochrome [Mycolicibacterium llatzerense]